MLGWRAGAVNRQQSAPALMVRRSVAAGYGPERLPKQPFGETPDEQAEQR
jgi:hypothetical protein